MDCPVKNCIVNDKTNNPNQTVYDNDVYHTFFLTLIYIVPGTCDQYDEMSCDNICINNRLICDGRNNCPNRQDERGCNTAETGSTG